MAIAEKITLNPLVIRADFPVLNQTIYKNQPLAYFDNGASTQRPNQVIQRIVDCYEQTYANVHRGIHYLSEQSSAHYESARQQVADFIGARHANEVIFTSGTTHAINLIAYAWGDANLSPGDEILLTLMEHHSNIVPWQQLAARVGAKVKFVGLTEDGQLDLEDYQAKLSNRTRLVAVCAVSNVLGTINPVEELTRLAHESGAFVLVDAAQHVPHDVTDVKQWNADFATFSGHKMLGPSGIGILYGKQQLLESMPPFMGGGSMISTVTVDGFTPGELPAKFEAGTPPIAQAIGLGAAIDYLKQFEMRDILAHERQLAKETMEILQEIDGLTILGPNIEPRGGIVSFVVDGLSTQDISILVDRKGFAIRAGHHCAMPLHDHLGIRNSCRVSYYLYNTLDEVQRFGEALNGVVRKLRK